MRSTLKLMFAFIALFQMYKLNGQTPVCTPNPFYKDSAAGIYPAPYNDSTKTGGIDKSVCIDKDFEFPFTVRIPDLVTVDLGFGPYVLGLEGASLDTAKAVTGLPVGIRYFCNPGNCVMKVNVLGCIVLKGKATSENKPGRYDLTINLKLNTTAFGTVEAAYPSKILPGRYFLNVAAANSNACLSSDIKLKPFEGSVKSFPVPAHLELRFTILALKSGSSNLTIHDIFGKCISQTRIQLHQGENQLVIPVSQFANGTYVYTLDQGGLGVSRKFSVLH